LTVLDLDIKRQVLTQGRAAAQRLLVLMDRGETEPASGSPPTGATQAGAGQAGTRGASPDPRTVAAKVYELLCKEFAAERIRRPR
jgi:hypothetical protein